LAEFNCRPVRPHVPAIAIAEAIAARNTVRHRAPNRVAGPAKCNVEEIIGTEASVAAMGVRYPA
jgi:hypothetical protein